jgi:hypothetical protein
LVTLLSLSASHCRFTVLKSLAGLFIFLGVFKIVISTVFVNNCILKVLTFLVGESLEVERGPTAVAGAVLALTVHARVLVAGLLVLLLGEPDTLGLVRSFVAAERLLADLNLPSLFGALSVGLAAPLLCLARVVTRACWLG